MPAKIILLISPLNKIGGKASFTGELLKAFSKNNIPYYHLDLVRATSNKMPIRLIQHFINFFVLKAKLVIILSTIKIDTIQIHTSSGFDFYDLSLFILIGKIFNKELILRYGGANFRQFHLESNWIFKKYHLLIFHIVDKIILQSKYWKKIFLEIGLNREKLFILPNFVNVLNYPQKTEYNNTNDINILFIPANALKRKGFYDLKDAIIKFVNQHDNVKFHIVGPDVGKYINNDRIIVYKEISGDRKYELFSRCSIYLLPTYSEGFPNSLLEAMASNMAIITTNIPQISCLVIDNVHCLLIDAITVTQFEEKLTELVLNPNLVEKLGKSARNLVIQNYDSSLLSNYLNKLYNE